MPLVNPFSGLSKPFKKSKETDDSDLKIGTPTNFKHNIQVKHDKEKNEFIGLPNEWRSLLERNNIKYGYCYFISFKIQVFNHFRSR